MAVSVAKDITPGKKRLAAFVGPPGKGVTQKVFAECHRRLKESGMVPYWVKEMPQSAAPKKPFHRSTVFGAWRGPSPPPARTARRVMGL